MACCIRVKNELGCSEIFVLTHESNQAAMQLYASMGGIRVAHDEAMFEFHWSEGVDSQLLHSDLGYISLFVINDNFSVS